MRSIRATFDERNKADSTDGASIAFIIALVVWTAGSPGDVNPGELHDGHPVDGAVRRWRIIYFDPKALSQLFTPDAPREIEFLYPSLTDQNLGRRVSRLFDRLVEGADRLGIEEIVAHVVQRLVSPEARPACNARMYPVPVERARARIEDDPSRPATLAELAALSDVSRYQIVRVFSRELGTTPYAYVIQRRVRLARELLVNGEALAATAQLWFRGSKPHDASVMRQFRISPGRYLSADA